MYARLYPRELDTVTLDDINDAICELVGVGKIQFYTSTARRGVYGCFPNWKDHQRLRDSKNKYPDPDDTTVNDWYLQRFISIDTRVAIIERDGFKCQICNKFITSDRNARRLIKHGAGMYHIDHIVPVCQGGRATMENLRLTCPACNQSRKKRFTFQEILNFAATHGNSADSAATCGELPRTAATCGELPPESNSNQNPNSNPKEKEKGAQAPTRHKHGQYNNVLLTDDEFEKLKTEFPDDWSARVDRLSEYMASTGKSYKNHLATIRSWARKDVSRSPQTYPQGNQRPSYAELAANMEAEWGQRK